MHQTLLSDMLRQIVYMLQFSSNTQERHLIAASCWTFDLEFVAEIHPETLETFDEEKINSWTLGKFVEAGTEPDGPSPITVATKHPAFRVSRPVFNSKFLSVDKVYERFPMRRRRMFFGQTTVRWSTSGVLRSNSVIREELSFVQHVCQDLAETFFIDKGK